MKETREIEPSSAEARKFKLAARRLASSLVFGMEDSIFHGTGIEYTQPRPYAPGDSIKLIDWKVTARTGKHFVKEYQETKRMPVYILIDTSASMCISSEKMSKYAWAVALGTGMALSAQANMMPAGLLGCGERKLHLKPTLSEGEIMQTALRLRQHGFLESTTLGARLRELAPSLNIHTMIVAISDLHDPDAVPALRSVGQKHETIVLHLQDKAERGIQGSGFFRGQEAETGWRFTGHGRKNFDHSDECKQALLRRGVDYQLLKTDEPILPKLQFFLNMRGKRASAGR